MACWCAFLSWQQVPKRCVLMVHDAEATMLALLNEQCVTQSAQISMRMASQQKFCVFASALCR